MSEEKKEVKEIVKEIKKEKKEKFMLLTFKENRSYELYLRRKKYIFMPYESRPIPAEDLKDPNFESDKILFNISEVK